MYKVYQRRNGGYILLNDAVISLFLDYKQNNGQYEAGGILLGHFRGTHIEVVFATQPGSNDQRGYLRFERKCTSHQHFAYEQWEQSNHEVTYIGEWHTHPQNIPQPSTADYIEWKKNLPNQEMLLCIQGINALWVGEQSKIDNNIREISEI